jgi:hypothetical protein
MYGEKLIGTLGSFRVGFQGTVTYRMTGGRQRAGRSYLPVDLMSYSSAVFSKELMFLDFLFQSILLLCGENKIKYLRRI